MTNHSKMVHTKSFSQREEIYRNFPKFTFTKFDKAVKETVDYYLSELNKS